MKPCWKCKQKAEWLREKLNVAREAAKKMAQDEKKTVAIWKEASEYKFGGTERAGQRIVEYILYDPNTAAA